MDLRMVFRLNVRSRDALQGGLEPASVEVLHKPRLVHHRAACDAAALAVVLRTYSRGLRTTQDLDDVLLLETRLQSTDSSLDRAPLRLNQVVEVQHESSEGEGHATRNLDRYAILSHQWEDDNEELNFDHIQDGDVSHAKKGWYKVAKCREQARVDGFNWIWADTCCIDKRSSAELQEAINSMYKYYQHAAVCYAYLRDVTRDNFEETFRASKWFFRGWTLQELIAPADVRFYDAQWRYLGSKNSLSLIISEITGIAQSILDGQTQLRECSVAQRMSWASRRNTKRPEDKAYSLLGIFDVNMPMLYGEGDKAFIRLQEEILKTSDDHSLFAWTGVQRVYPGLLASGPDKFTRSENIVNAEMRTGRQPHTMNNRGLSMTLPLVPYCTDTYLALINCHRINDLERRRASVYELERRRSSIKDLERRSSTLSILSEAAPPSLMGIFLRRLHEDDQYARVKVFGKELVDDPFALLRREPVSLQRPVNIRQRPLLPSEWHYYQDRHFGFRLHGQPFRRDSRGEELFKVGSSERCRWSSADRTITQPPGSHRLHTVGILDLTKQRLKIQQIRLGFDDEFNPAVVLMESAAIDDLDDHPSRPQYLRIPSDHASWSEIVTLKDRRKFAKAQDTRSGRKWSLKGDRIDGLDVYLEDSSRPTNKQDYSHIAGRVRLDRGESGGCLIWDLVVEDLSPSSGSRIFK